jgi:hypothetical protein
MIRPWPLLLLLAACAGAPDGETAAEPDAPSGERPSALQGMPPADDPARLSLPGGPELAVLEHRRAREVGVRTAPESETYALVRLRLVNGGETPFAFIDRQFRIGWAGEHRAPELFAPAPDFGGSGSLPPGMAREGWMVFRGPADAPADSLFLAPEIGEPARAGLALPAPE